MRNFAQTTAAAAICAGLTGPVVAAEATGDLKVERDVSAQCFVPEAQGEVSPPAKDADFDAQDLSSAIEVTVTCAGGADVTAVVFGGGENRGLGGPGAPWLDNAMRGDAETSYDRVMYNGEAGSCLSYELHAGPTSGNLTKVEHFGDRAIADNVSDDKRVTVSNGTFFVAARLTGGSSANPIGDCFNHGEPKPVGMPGGIYSDTVTMTVFLS